MKEPAINLPADPGIRSCIPDLFSGELVRIPVGCSTAFGDPEMQQQGCQPPQAMMIHSLFSGYLTQINETTGSEVRYFLHIFYVPVNGNTCFYNSMVCQ